MEVLRILFALGFLAPGYYAMEIQPSMLPRNLDVYCKVCDGLSAVFDNFSYEDYDFWRTIDIQEKVRFFCSFCKKKTESTTLPMTESGTTTPATTTNSFQPETAETSPVPVITPSTPESASSMPETSSPTPETTPSTPETQTTEITSTTTSTTPQPLDTF